MDFPTSMNFNALMDDTNDMEEKFSIMELTIEALKKFVHDNNLHIAQLRNKLEAFTPGESSHVPTFLSGESIYRCLMNFYLRNLLIIVNQRGWKKSIRLVTLNTANSIVSLDRSKRFILKEKIMILVSEGKIIIVQDETAEANNASVETNQQKCSRLLFMPNTTFLRFGSLALI